MAQILRKHGDPHSSFSKTKHYYRHLSSVYRAIKREMLRGNLKNKNDIPVFREWHQGSFRFCVWY